MQAMAKKRRHSRAEIATKLAQANGLVTQGKVQSDIARTLGVSVMTLYRWRKATPGTQPAHETGEPGQMRGGGDRIAKLQLENSRLRRRWPSRLVATAPEDRLTFAPAHYRGA